MILKINIKIIIEKLLLLLMCKQQFFYLYTFNLDLFKYLKIKVIFDIKKILDVMTVAACSEYSD